jgi:hypothetical protein
VLTPNATDLDVAHARMREAQRRSQLRRAARPTRAPHGTTHRSIWRDLITVATTGRLGR